MSLSLSRLDCWALSVDLVNVLLSCPDVINVPGCEVDLSLPILPVFSPPLPSPLQPSQTPLLPYSVGSLRLSHPGSFSRGREETFRGEGMKEKFPFQTSIGFLDVTIILVGLWLLYKIVISVTMTHVTFVNISWGIETRTSEKISWDDK